MRQINPVELKQRLDSTEPRPVLLDVREQVEYGICHINGSLLVPMGQIVAKLGELDRDKEIVAICHHGVRSFQVAQYLEHEGFEKIMNLSGGIDAWAMEVEPSMARY